MANSAPIIIPIIIIGLYLFCKFVIYRFPKIPLLTPIIKDIKFGIEDWHKTIIIPILLVLFVYFGISIIFTIWGDTIGAPPYESIPIYFLTRGVLAPISEEIIQCLFLSFIFITSGIVYYNKTILIGANGLGLLVSAFFFTIGQLDTGWINWVIHFISFIIYGALYYFNNRNMLPAIIAHSCSNLILLAPVLL
jgi:hypothetical protein